MSHTTTAPERPATTPRSSRLRSLLAAVDRYTLRSMNAPAELGGARPQRPGTIDSDTTGPAARR